MRIRVLVVDDEAEFAETLAERLTLRGFDTRATTSGRVALDIVRTRTVDVVILDVKMPGIDGLKVIREMLVIEPELPVVLLTGHGSRQDAEEGKRLGAFSYLMKPVDIVSLVAVLDQAVVRPGAKTNE